MVKKRNTLILFLILFIFISSCIDSAKKPERPSFRTVIGTRFYESKRLYDNGLSFNEFGYQLEPEWELFFKNDTAVSIYSPSKKQFGSYKIYYYQDSIFNFAREFWKLKKLSNDSVLFRLIRVKNGRLSEELSNVYMTFYSDAYMKTVLRRDLNSFRIPGRRDTLFIRSKSEQADANLDKAFAARVPVTLQSNSRIIQVEKIKFKDDPMNRLEGKYESEEYLLPEYRIKISGAYTDFNYNIWVIVDSKGKIHFKDFAAPVKELTPEFYEPKVKVVNGIIDVYLHRLLKITPGNTLGIIHPSMINLRIEGVKDIAGKKSVEVN